MSKIRITIKHFLSFHEQKESSFLLLFTDVLEVCVCIAILLNWTNTSFQQYSSFDFIPEQSTVPKLWGTLRAKSLLMRCKLYLVCNSNGKLPMQICFMPFSWQWFLTHFFLQALLSVHDIVAEKSYDPVLPPMPDDIDNEEDSVKIIRLVKNREPLVRFST